MKLKILSLSFAMILLSIASSCQRENLNAVDTIMATLKTDNDFINLQTIFDERVKNLKEDKFNLKKANMELIKKEEKSCKTIQDLIKLHEKAGILYAEEYIVIPYKITAITSKIKKKYPQINELKKEDRKKIWAVATTSKE